MLGAIIAVVLISSVIVLGFEKKHNPEIQTYGDALWMQFITMATVGYGDKVPITPGGKVTVIISMVMGITLLTGFITSSASRRVEKAQRRAKGLDKSTSLKDHFVVMGWNQRGKYVLQRLADASTDESRPIVLLCSLEETPMVHDLVFFYQGSPTSEVDQRRANVEGAKSIILLADELTGGKSWDIDARTVLAALTARSINPKAEMTAEVLEPENAQHLARAGVEEILDNNIVGGNLLAQSAIRYGIIELVSALSRKEAAAKVYRVPLDPELVGKTCGEAAVELERAKNYVVMGIRKADGAGLCDMTHVLAEGESLFVLSPKPPPDTLGTRS